MRYHAGAMAARRATRVVLGLVAFLVLTLTAAELGARLSQGNPGWALAQRLGNQGSNFYRWKRLLLENADEVAVGCSYKDCIPTIYGPTFNPVDEANEWLANDDRVIGLEHGGTVKAYPLKILNYHEVVNDQVGNEPILVTYCPLCASAVGFQRTFADETLTFGTSGVLHHSNLVLFDHETESFWDQITGEGIAGPHTADQLDRIPLDVARWSEWRKAHPNTFVLARQTGSEAPDYSSYPYGDYRTSNSVYFDTAVSDDRLAPKTKVIGVFTNGVSAAYPQRVLASRTVVNDRLGDTPVAIVRHPTSGVIRAFQRQVADETLTFRWDDGGLIDLETRSEWRLSGEAVSGTHQGTQLGALHTTPSFWFAWAAYHPNTSVFALTSAPDPDQDVWAIAAWSGYAALGGVLVPLGIAWQWRRFRQRAIRATESVESE